MFGKNPLRKQTLHPDGSLWVQEVFSTIQGEGPMAGRPAIFVRLAGCNLRCWFCDTDFESGTDTFTPEALLDEVAQCDLYKTTRFVVLTGGEPLRQNIVPFIRWALANLIEVQIETAGTVWVPGLEELIERSEGKVTIVCSPKTGKVAPEIKKLCRHYKYIVSESMGVDEETGIPLCRTQSDISSGKLFIPGNLALNTIWLQPCDEQSYLTQLNTNLCVQLATKYGHRLSLQLHKILHLP